MKKEKKIVIIGGGPTGLGAAWKLHELGYTNWVMFEKKPYFGGHSTTHTDPQGFKWDEGGHVLFSHYPYFDNFVKKVLKKDFYSHERESHILLPGAKVPYPFQNNVRYLKPEDQTFCLGGLAQVQGQKKKAKNFHEWINLTFGEGIAEVFMLPYNFRVWATPLKKMSHKWIEERVSVPDFQRALKNVLCGIDDVAWGPNNTFLFPKTGGTGEMYERAGRLLGKNIETNKEVVGISIQTYFFRWRKGTLRLSY